MRCDQCNKFAAYDDSNEPEIVNEGVDAIEARIYLTCADCGTELKEATFAFDSYLPDDLLAAHDGDGHELAVTIDNAELTSRQDGKPGTKARYRRTFYGVQIEYSVCCSCQDGTGDESAALFSGELSDDCQASAMDELV
jgi:hypothetical protein